MDRSKRNAYIALALAMGAIAGLIIVILLLVGGGAAVIIATGAGVFAGISGLVIAIMAACGAFSHSPPP